MLLSSHYLVTVQRLIPANRQALFDIVADPAQHPVIDGSGTVRAIQPGGPDRLGPGVKFGMDMRMAANYKILNTVVEFEEGRLIGWRHFNGHIWRYKFADAPDGTLVVEEWDARTAHNRPGLVLMGFPWRNRRGMTATLKRLEQVATGAADDQHR